MSSAKWSSKGDLSTVKKGIQVMTLDQTASNADANKLATLEQLFFGEIVTEASTTGVLAAPPAMFVYIGLAAGTRSLPAGSADIVGLPFQIWVEGGFKLTVQTTGADTFSQYAYPDNQNLEIDPGVGFTVRWTGSIWMIK